MSYTIPRAGRALPLAELAAQIGAELRGDGAAEVDGCAGLEEATERDISFLTRPSYSHLLESTRAAAVVLSAESAERFGFERALVAEDPYFAFRQAVVALYGFRRQPGAGTSELAFVAADAEVASSASIEPFAYVASGAVIGERTVVHAHVHVGARARIGSDTLLYPGVAVYEDCIVGDRVIVHSGRVIGQDGFGHATHEGAHHKIPQVGIAVVEDDVELGANCSIDRGTLGATIVGKGTKFSNNVVIGHGTQVGEHNLYVAQVGLAGSVKTGRYVVIGGQSGVSGHIELGDGTQLASKSVLYKSSPNGGTWYGTPAIEIGRGQRAAALHARLPEMAREVRQLKEQVAALEAALEDRLEDDER
jgi:UDP-3-O-[3-hydroxymyristoyl] glucosamine N-acyltransferase